MEPRKPALRVFGKGLIVDNFAGGGGASTGLSWALGRSPDLAINHDPQALAMHRANHPDTKHLCNDVFDVDPVAACGGRPVELAWFSPDCTFFSKSRGGKPFRERHKARRRRGLAWVVVKWAKAVQPRVIILENVEEFADWGPLGPDNRPDPRKKGFTFRRWWAAMENAGYRGDMKELRGCDFGAPTIRKRLFIQFRRDGRPITWPRPTHGPGRAKPYRTAAECIDFSLPCPSIFERKRPLADATLRRIARGIMRYVVNDPKPFIVPLTHAGDSRVHPITEPFRTVTGAHRGEHALITPFIARTAHGDVDSRGKRRGRGEHSLGEPLPTVLSSNDYALVAPTLIQTGRGERPGQAPRVPGLHKPLGTVQAEGVKHAYVAAFLAKHYGGHETDGQQLALPLSTVTARDHHALVTASGFLLKEYGSCRDGQPFTEPMGTVTARGNHIFEVRAFLLSYYGTDQDPRLQLPLPTITTKDRFALVTVDIGGDTYVIVDIGMRMLTPRELFRAQGFPDGYVINPIVPKPGRHKNGDPKRGPLSRTGSVRMCGNSVCPDLAYALGVEALGGEDDLLAAA
jgi:DNA (cytosine-5)-methyltransferase 1